MPDYEPMSDVRVRNVPRSDRLLFRAQAVARGLTLAQWLGKLVRAQEAGKSTQEEPK